MATDIFKHVIGIISQHLHPLKAQAVVEKYCNEHSISCDTFKFEDVPQFILFLAKERDNMCTLDDNKFHVLLGSLVSYSNTIEMKEVANV